MKPGSYIAPVETFTHSQFQHYTLYGFRVRTSQPVVQLQFPEKAGFQSTVYISNAQAKKQKKGAVQASKL